MSNIWGQLFDDFRRLMQESLEEFPDIIDAQEEVLSAAPEEEEVESGKASEVQDPYGLSQGTQSYGMLGGYDLFESLTQPSMFSQSDQQLSLEQPDELGGNVESTYNARTVEELKDEAVAAFVEAVEKNE